VAFINIGSSSFFLAFIGKNRLKFIHVFSSDCSFSSSIHFTNTTRRIE